MLECESEYEFGEYRLERACVPALCERLCACVGTRMTSRVLARTSGGTHVC